MTQIPSALPEPAAPAPAPGAAALTGAPIDTPFAEVLDDERARGDGAGADRRPVAAPVADAALAALLGGVPTGASPPTAPMAEGAEPEPLGGRVLTPGFAGGASPGARTSAFGGLPATRPIGEPADGSASAAPGSAPPAGSAAPVTASSPSLPVGWDAAGAEGRGDAPVAQAPPPAATSANRLADVLQATSAGASAIADPAATPAPATVAGATNRAHDAADGQRPAPAASAASAPPAAAPVTPAPPAAAHAAHAAAPSAPAPPRPVGLDHAVETVRLALRAGAERGVSHARISLTPRELGTVEVHLRHTADGLVARVVAEHANAVQQLQQAGAELRRSLEQQGLTLLRLDVGASGEHGGHAAGRHASAEAGAFGDGDRRTARGAGGDALGPLDGVADGDARETTTTLQLPNGALVDVLA